MSKVAVIFAAVASIATSAPESIVVTQPIPGPAFELTDAVPEATFVVNAVGVGDDPPPDGGGSIRLNVTLEDISSVPVDDLRVTVLTTPVAPASR